MEQPKFDLARFRQDLKAAYAELGDKAVRELIVQGIKEAVDERLRDLISFEYPKALQDILAKEKDALFGRDELKSRDPRELVREAIRGVAKSLAREQVHRTVK